LGNPRIVRIRGGIFEGRRPRHAGSNARLGDHGEIVRVPIVQLTTADGATGFGRSRASPEELRPLLGDHLDTAFKAGHGAAARWLPCEYPLWDLIGQRAAQPVYSLAAAINERTPPPPYRVRTYDTSLYFDDLHLSDNDEAAALIADEARQGYARGHRAFKIKVGRGARHLPLDIGTARDIAIVRAVRAAVGPEAPIMLDANNGYNLNLTKQVLRETADCTIHWIEEPFHEDPILYRDLRDWLTAEGLTTLIADGEGDASPRLLDWAHDGLIDVVQYDIFSYGFTPWLATGRQLDDWGRRSAPHHYGAHYGNYAAGHLAGAIGGFTFVEWDEVTTPSISAEGYAIDEGWVTIPAAPGFGLTLDEDRFAEAVAKDGFDLRL